MRALRSDRDGRRLPTYQPTCDRAASGLYASRMGIGDGMTCLDLRPAWPDHPAAALLAVRAGRFSWRLGVENPGKKGPLPPDR